MSIKRVLVFLYASTIAVGCAGCYRPIVLEPTVLAVMPSCVKDEDLEICADAYAEAARQQALFQADLSNIGVLPVLIRVSSVCQRTYRLRQADISLSGSDGQVRNRLFAGTVARAATTRYNVGRPVGADPFWLPGGIILGGVEAHSEAARFDDYRSKELTDAVLGPHESVHGFIYFAGPAGAEATLRISVIEVGELKRHDYELPILGMESR